MNKFDSIRPYNDSEVNKVLLGLSSNRRFLKMLFATGEYRNIKYLPSRKGERHASALTNISLNNKVFKNFGKISLKDYISSFIKDH